MARRYAARGLVVAGLLGSLLTTGVPVAAVPAPPDGGDEVVGDRDVVDGLAEAGDSVSDRRCLPLVGCVAQRLDGTRERERLRKAARRAARRALEEGLQDTEATLEDVLRRRLESLPDDLPPVRPPDTPLLPDLPQPPELPVLPPAALPEAPESLLPEAPLPGGEEEPRDPADAESPRAEATPGLLAYTSPVVLTAGSARMVGFSYEGVAELPLADGGTVRMMKFTARSFEAYDEVDGDIARGEDATVLTSPALTFRGDIVIYATEMSATLMGVPVSLTPGNAQSRLLEVLQDVTPVAPVTMTQVVARQPILLADSMVGDLLVAAG